MLKPKSEYWRKERTLESVWGMGEQESTAGRKDNETFLSLVD